MLTITAPEDSTIPVNAEGAGFYAAFVRSDGETIFSDTLTEIVGHMINDYPAGSDTGSIDEAFVARLDQLAELAKLHQAIVTAFAAGDHDFTEDELTVMLSEKVDVALELDEPWQRDVPLFLLTTNYAPYTDIPKVLGDAVVWLDPTNEFTFLESLSALGTGKLLVNDLV